MTIEASQFKAAESREGFSHPILGVFAQHSEQIIQLNQQYNDLIISGNSSESGSRQRALVEQYSFLADGLTSIDTPWTLEPLQLVSLWKVLEETFPRGPVRYTVAKTIVAAYAIQGLENPAWKDDLKGFFLEKNILAEETFTPTENDVRHVLERVQGIGRNIKDLDNFGYGYRLGEDESVIERWKSLKQKAEDDPTIAPWIQAELDHLVYVENQMQKEYPIIQDIKDGYKLEGMLHRLKAQLESFPAWSESPYSLVLEDLTNADYDPAERIILMHWFTALLTSNLLATPADPNGHIHTLHAHSGISQPTSGINGPRDDTGQQLLDPTKLALITDLAQQGQVPEIAGQFLTEIARIYCQSDLTIKEQMDHAEALTKEYDQKLPETDKIVIIQEVRRLTQKARDVKIKVNTLLSERIETNTDIKPETAALYQRFQETISGDFLDYAMGGAPFWNLQDDFTLSEEAQVQINN